MEIETESDISSLGTKGLLQFAFYIFYSKGLIFSSESCEPCSPLKNHETNTIKIENSNMENINWAGLSCSKHG